MQPKSVITYVNGRTIVMHRKKDQKDLDRIIILFIFAPDFFYSQEMAVDRDEITANTH